MIIERNEFRLKFGKAKEAIAIWTNILNEFKNHKESPRMRLMTDLSGPAYTIIVELELKSLIDYGAKNYQWMTNNTAHELYQQFIPLCDSAQRTMYHIECEI